MLVTLKLVGCWARLASGRFMAVRKEDVGKERKCSIFDMTIIRGIVGVKITILHSEMFWADISKLSLLSALFNSYGTGFLARHFAASV
jgi:hypothetical protein